ncbi:hypothetical protein [Streptomyces sp. NPDC050560]|uniref:hypothetical protein n=1 Tax=Streptomyces sp. NPDC050560 TaxID=3365630 RepID=UPI0037B6719F
MDSPTPARLPRHLLAQPTFRQALRERDFALVFTMAHAAGLSFNRLGEGCGIKSERVSKVARGTAAVTALDTVERIADGLRIPGSLLGLAARPWEDSPAPDAHDGEDPMKRRQMLRGALAAGLTGTALAALTTARQTVDQSLAADAPADLADLEAATETYGYGYHGRPPLRFLADIAADFSALRPMMDVPQAVATRTRLCRTAGQMAGMAAIVFHDLGARSEARRWFATARRAADESGDPQLCAWLYAREAMVPLNYGAPRAAAQLAEAARRAAGDRPTSAATLAAAVAGRAYALCQQPERAREALAAADAMMERLAPGERADTWLTHGEQKHRVHLSHALTALGATRRAREQQHRALELSAPTSTMTRTLLLIDNATCAHHEGETEEACRRAASVLVGLPHDYRPGIIRSRALDLCRSIPPRHHHEPAVRELANLLAA